MRKSTLLGWIICSIFVGQTGEAKTKAKERGDPKKGKAHYQLCAACHGASGEGNRQLNSPRLAGQEAWYIVRQLKNFKDGIRGSNPKDLYGPQMRPMAQALPDDKAMEDVAAYIATFKIK